MRKRIGFVAVGQAAGNIGQLLEVEGFTVLYLNTSTEDLETLQNAKYRYHIRGGEGCSKKRARAKKLVVEDYDNIFSEIESKMADAEILFTIFASGGGTGSGAGPMLTDLLLDDDKTVGSVVILPGEDESTKARSNSYECMKELLSLDGTAAMFVLDNKTNNDKLAINKAFVSDFVKYVDIPSTFTSVLGNFDKSEVIESLETHGMAVLSTTRADNSREVLEQIRNGIYASVEKDGVVKYISGSIIDGVDLGDIKKEVGHPLDMFVVPQAEENRICCSGLSYPIQRLDAIYESVKMESDNVNRSLKGTRGIELKGDINLFDDDSTKKAKEKASDKEQRKLTRKELMKKYL